MTKEEFFIELNVIRSDSILITDSTENLVEEIRQNNWLISIPEDLLEEFSVSELSHFLKEVKTNRQEQLKKATIEINLIYYLWFDEQAGQLRLNFINSNHSTLPFKAALLYVDSEEEIINCYLSRIFSADDRLKIYKEIIYR